MQVGLLVLGENRNRLHELVDVLKTREVVGSSVVRRDGWKSENVSWDEIVPFFANKFGEECIFCAFDVPKNALNDIVWQLKKLQHLSQYYGIKITNVRSTRHLKLENLKESAVRAAH